MTDESTRLNRRNVLKAIGGTGVAAAVGGGALLTLGAGSATAVGTQSLNAGTASTDDGELTKLDIWGDSRVEWQGFDTEAVEFQVLTEVEVVQDWDGQTAIPATQINDTGKRTLNGDWGGSGEGESGPGTSGWIESGVGLDSNGNHDESNDWAILQASDYDDEYGLPANPVDPSPEMDVSESNSPRNFTVNLLGTYIWFASDGSEIFRKTFTTPITVTVENLESSATALDGSGNDGASAS